MPYSLDLRERVIDAIHSGMKKVTVCKMYKVCKQTLYNWLALKEKQGHLNPITGFQKGHSHGISDFEAFKKYVDDHRDHTQEELAGHFAVGSSTIGRALEKIGYSRKKKAKPIRKEVKKNEKSTWKK